MVESPFRLAPVHSNAVSMSLRSLIHADKLIEAMRGKALTEDLDGGNAFEKSFMPSINFASCPSAQVCEAAAHGVAGLEPRKAFHRFPHKLRRYECGRFERHYGDRDLA